MKIKFILVVVVVAVDMWDPFISSVKGLVPEATKKIVFDKFHAAQQLGEGVDQLRSKESMTLKAAGDDRLTGMRYDWPRSRAAMELRDRREFNVLRRSGLKTARAGALKETAMAL